MKRKSNKKDTSLKIDKKLDKYLDKGLFKEKIEYANKVLKTAGLPKTK